MQKKSRQDNPSIHACKKTILKASDSLTVIAAVALISFFGTHDKVQLYKIVLNNHTKSCVNKAIAFRKIPDYEKEIADIDKQINQLSQEIDNLCQE